MVGSGIQRSIADLARRLGTNTNYLSRALNEGLGQNFSEFVNRQRIAEAQRMLAGPGEVLDIALAVGFGSKASFNRAFLAYTGRTPSASRICSATVFARGPVSPIGPTHVGQP